MVFEDIADFIFFGNTVRDYTIAISVFIVSLALLWIFKHLLMHKLKRAVKKTESRLDDALVGAIDFHWPFYVFASLYLALKLLLVPTKLEAVFNYILLFIATFYVVRGINRMIDYSAHRMMKDKEEEEHDVAVIDLMGKLGKVALWLFAIIFILGNMGYNITTLVAGLGIGGIAIAFALQNILADIFASFSIYIDKPFKVGDFIIVGADMGIVQNIGIKSTRITTLHGQELIMSNKELTETRVNNYKHMQKRRIVFNFGVTYKTTTKKLQEIPKIVNEIIDKIDDATFDRTHWKEYGDSALVYEVVYYVESSDYLLYCDIQEKINLGIKEKLEKKKIEFAYPTQTIYLSK